MKQTQMVRRVVAVLILLGAAITWLIINPDNYEKTQEPIQSEVVDENAPLAVDVLARLEVKGRAPKTGYRRDEFYTNWPDINGCDARNVVLARDLVDTVIEEDGNRRCIVLSGILNDPYTGDTISFVRGPGTSSLVHIDHVVALSDAWQKGAQYLDKSARRALASDPLNLLAVEGKINMAKGDSDAASWLPPNKAFRCQFVARQISVKYKYDLWVTAAERDAIVRVLEKCPDERAMGVAF
jgi:hypothetical protein